MNTTVAHPPPSPRTDAPPTSAPAIPPILPVLVPLVVAAIVLSAAFAYLFPATSERPAPVARFTDVTEDAGLQVNVAAEEEPPTTLGGGAVAFDYDNDGRADLCFIHGAPWPWQEQLAKQPGRTSLSLFHNDGGGRFSDVTARAGLLVEFQGMTAAAGDFDADGLTDLYVTCVGSNHLFRNRGNGRFEDVTEVAGVGGDDQTWSTAAVWQDHDFDGRLDLIVAHYARWSPDIPLEMAFTVARVGRSYGTPTGFVSAFPTVYRNLGDGRFEPVAGSAGLRDVDPQTGLPVAHPLALVPVDLNGDSRLDLLISYHQSPNALFLAQSDGTFRKWQSGRDDRHEGAATFLSTGLIPLGLGAADPRLAAFDAAAARAALGADGALQLSAKLGIVPLDYELDGRVEYLSAEARMEPAVNRFEQGRGFASNPALYWRDAGSWRAAEMSAATAAIPPMLVRGLAAADFDGDGDLDLALAQHGASPRLWRNDQRLALPWLRVRLNATRSAPGAGGAQVEVHTPRSVLRQTAVPAMSFMGQSESVLTFGLGDDARVRKIVVRWPSGWRDELRPSGVNQTIVIEEGRHR